MRLWIASLASLMMVLALQSFAFAQLDDKVADRLWESSKVMDELVKGPDAGIPKDLLKLDTLTSNYLNGKLSIPVPLQFLHSINTS